MIVLFLLAQPDVEVVLRRHMERNMMDEHAATT